MHVSRRSLVLIGLWAFGALVLFWQVVLAALQPNFQGLLPYGGSEEAMYMLRTQHALLHPFSNSTNGVWSLPPTSGPQAAGLEEFIGSAFFWTGLSAPWIVFLLTILITPFVLPLMALLFERVGLKSPWSPLASIAFFALLGFCRRYFHPGFSLPLVLTCILLFFQLSHHPTKKISVVLGVLLGFSVGVYLWAWTFLWTVLLALTVLLVREGTQAHRRCLLFTWMTGAIVALPTLLRLFFARLHPEFEAAALRVGLASTHLPESWLRSILTIIIAFLLWFVFSSREDRRKYRVLFALTIALAVVYNQQLLHGTVMSFSSHYVHYFFVSCALIIAALASGKQYRGFAGALLVCSALPLGGALYDHSGRYGTFLPPHAWNMSFQHLRGALDALAEHEKEVILTDRNTADIVASYTHHDAVFTEYSSFLLISDIEFIERACLSEVFSPSLFPYETQVVYAEERLKVIRRQQTEEELQDHLRAARKHCESIRENPLPYFIKYGVTLLFWDELHHPDWKIDQSLFEQVVSGDGWSLFAPSAQD